MGPSRDVANGSVSATIRYETSKSEMGDGAHENSRSCWLYSEADVDMKLIMQYLRKPKMAGALAAGVTFAFGFVAMNAFWALGRWDQDVPGLWDYRSATMGDGLLLPVAAGALAAEIAKLPRAKNENIAIASLLAVGSIGGALVIRSWVGDPANQGNWTQSASGSLNWAGRWHAVFLMSASAAFLTAFGVLLLRLRSAQADEVQAFLGSTSMRALVSTAIGFLGLVMLDNLGAGISSSNLVSVASTTIMTVSFVLAVWWIGRRYGLEMDRRLTWSAANGVALVVIGDIIARRGAGLSGNALGIVILVCIGAAVDARFRGDRWWADRVIPAGVGLWLAMSWLGTLTSGSSRLVVISYLVALAVTGLAAGCLLGYWRWGLEALDRSGVPTIWGYGKIHVGKSVSPVFLLIFAPLAWAGLALIQSKNPDAFGANAALITGIAISFLGSRIARVGIRYHRETIIERELIQKDAWNKFIVLIAFAVAVFWSLLWIVIVDVQSEKKLHASSALHVWPLAVVTCAGLVAILGSLLLGSLWTPARDWGRTRAYVWSLRLAVVGVLIWGAGPWITNGPGLTTNGFAVMTLEGGYRIAVALYLGAVLGWFIRQSLFWNGFRLPLKNPMAIELHLLNCVGLASASIFMWLFAFGFWYVSPRQFWLFVELGAGGLFGVIAVNATVARLFQSKERVPGQLPEKYVIHPHWRNAIQDGLLFGALTIFSYFVFRSLGAALTDFSAAAEQIVVLLGFGFPIIIAYLYEQIVQNNNEHLERVKDSHLPWDDQYRAHIQAMEFWLPYQNRIAQRLCPTVPLMLWWHQLGTNDEKQEFKHRVSPTTVD